MRSEREPTGVRWASRFPVIVCLLMSRSARAIRTGLLGVALSFGLGSDAAAQHAGPAEPISDEALFSVDSPVGAIDYVAGRGLRLGRTGFHVGGYTFWYGRDDDALRRWKGREVLVAVDPEDVSQAVVFTPDRQLLTVVPMNDRIAPFGADAQQLRDAIRTVRRARGDRKKAMQTAAVRMRTPQDILREHQANEIRGADDGPPPPGDGATFIPVQTGFESASKAVETHRRNVKVQPWQPRGLADVMDADADRVHPTHRTLSDLPVSDDRQPDVLSILARLEEAVSDE